MLSVMVRSSTRRIAALLLGIFLALGMGFTDIYASTMPGAMSVTNGMAMGDTGRMDCDPCGGAGNEGMQGGDCSAVCVGQTLALSPSGSTDTALRSRQPLLPPAVPLSGRMSAPDPHPPKTIRLA